MAAERKGKEGRSGRGFASMDEDKQKEIARKGGKAAHKAGTAHEFTSEEAAEAGRKGGLASGRRRAELQRERERQRQAEAEGEGNHEQEMQSEPDTSESESQRGNDSSSEESYGFEETFSFEEVSSCEDERSKRRPLEQGLESEDE